MRIVFEHAHGSFSCIEARSAAFQDLITGRQSTLEARAIFTLTFRRHFAALDRSGAAMDYEANFARLHVCLIFWTVRTRSRSRLRRFVGKRERRCTKEQECE